ncbi:hypothetical protein BDP27DRAFT_1368161 [Rhodocollybia butyracea]|uniref:Uncharacterized protein n=1 Tax=Rhodocollybia butyracea TaxID=206335 RepID=A0A9P5PJN6_9AGAR|nr:hypothetical protein BDP27DRAFT_1368161 [Rhodocollybia butyracea]
MALSASSSFKTASPISLFFAYLEEAEMKMIRWLPGDGAFGSVKLTIQTTRANPEILARMTWFMLSHYLPPRAMRRNSPLITSDALTVVAPHLFDYLEFKNVHCYLIKEARHEVLCSRQLALCCPQQGREEPIVIWVVTHPNTTSPVVCGPSPDIFLILADYKVEGEQGTVFFFFHEKKYKNSKPSARVLAVSNKHVLRADTTVDYQSWALAHLANTFESSDSVDFRALLGHQETLLNPSAWLKKAFFKEVNA